MHTINLIIPRTPVSVNHLYNHRVMKGRLIKFKTADGKKFGNDFETAFKTKYPTHTPFTGECRVRITVYKETKRKCDVDNFGKAILDAMNGLVYEDDSQVREITIRKEYSKNDPKTHVVIEWT